ncbi:MAG: response regulator [Alphaproteobacteria bacterium]|nr:response regulator [Alphaproteobacteria bacterium]
MDELISEFLSETNDSLGDLDNQLIVLEQNPDDHAIIDSIFRVMHTIKGTCGFLGLDRLAKVAHASEDVLDNIRNEALKPTPQVISLILESIDRIKSLVEALEESGAEPQGSDQELIEKLHDCATGKLSSVSAAVAAEPAPVEMLQENEAATSDTDALQAAFDAAPGPEEEGGIPTDSDDLQALFDATPGPADMATPPQKADAGISNEAKAKAVAAGLAATEKTAAKEKDEGGEKDKNANQFIRVNLGLLENLMQMASELVLTRNQLLQLNRNAAASTFNTPLQRLSHITSDLQEGVMKTRMQAIGNAWSKFPRIVRDLSIDLGKKIDLVMVGEDTEIDRQMLEMVKDPLTHMVRNACDHGMDNPEQRRAAGKNETGKVTLHAYHEGGNVIIKISDDGPGINVDKVKKKAIDSGLTTEAEAATMSNKQIYQFILKPGFSTADKVTAVSGRGVGMDVVVSNIVKIGGTLEVNSVPGKGSDFIVKLPLTLAIMSVLVIETGGQSYAIPQLRVSEIVHAKFRDQQVDNTLNNEEFYIETLNQSKVLRLRGELLPLISLNEILKLPPKEEPKPEGNVLSINSKAKKQYVVICEMGSHHFGLMVDRVFDTEEIVVKPLSPMVRGIDVFSGCTILGDGSVIMILDPNGLIKTMGNINFKKEEEQEHKLRNVGSGEERINFLLFRAGGKAPRAVPVELVSRLEEIDTSKIEWAGNRQVIQYRGELMRLVTADDSYQIPKEGIAQVVVFNDEGKVMGLVVEHIIDIIEHKMNVRSLVGQSGILGSLVINEATYDLIDVGFYFSNTFSDWLATKEMETKSGKIATDGAAKRILLIDDSPFFRKFMKPILIVANYQVVTAENALKALDILEESADFDAIITDIDMPHMTGLEFAEKCKENPRLKHIPLVALTSYASSDVREKDTKNCFNGFVSKSDRDKLVDTITQILHHTMAA